MGETEIVGMQISVGKIDGRVGNEAIAVDMGKSMGATLVNHYFSAIIQRAGLS